MRILFISHNATRSGAPILLLSLIEYLKRTRSLEILIVLGESGELEKEFQKFGKTYIISKNNKWKNPIFSKIYKKLIDPCHLFFIKHRLNTKKIDLIYANTFSVGFILKFINPKGIRVITHVHEMVYTIRSFGDENNDAIKKYTHEYIAVSEAVKNGLVNTFDIEDVKINTVYGFLPKVALKFNKELSSQLRKLLNIPNEAFIIGGSGNASWGKGTDLFVQLAFKLIKKNPNFYFVWVGANTGWLEEFYNQLHYDMDKLEISNKLIFTGSVTNPYDYYNIFDAFALTSREDSFPLVCLENAAFGNPILCFDKAGGIKEFIYDNNGIVVPYLDLDIMATKLINLYNSKELRNTIGLNAQKKVRESHNQDAICKKIEAIINV